jgi:cytochrome c
MHASMLRNLISPIVRRASAIALLGVGIGPAAAGPADRSGDAERGRLLMAHYQCGRCHAIPGVVGARGRLAVPLDAFGARSYIAGRIPNDPATLTRWIVDPPSLVPATPMPNLGVSAPEARDMAAYLGRLR